MTTWIGMKSFQETQTTEIIRTVLHLNSLSSLLFHISLIPSQQQKRQTGKSTQTHTSQFACYH